MSKTQRTLVDFDGADGDESDDENVPDWTPTEKGSHSGADGLECECGRPLTMWTSPVMARQYVRLFGNEDEDTVPGCPGCVSWRDNDSERVESIPHAIREMDTESTTDAHNHRELLVKHARRRFDGGR